MPISSRSTPIPTPRPPGRTVEIHLTGNMERFMWAFDGEAFGPLKKAHRPPA
jgi:FtsP/CotA-like multicopper oxidase with cupredoxin domain